MIPRDMPHDISALTPRRGVIADDMARTLAAECDQWGDRAITSPSDATRSDVARLLGLVLRAQAEILRRVAGL